MEGEIEFKEALLNKNNEKYINLLNLSAKKNYPLAIIELYLYYMEKTTPRTTPRSTYESIISSEKLSKLNYQWFYDQAEKKKDIISFYYIGLYCFYNLKRRKYKEGFSWMLKSAIQGYSDAQYHVGVCYQCGHGIELNLEQSIYW
jgi:TPR repeat protein